MFRRFVALLAVTVGSFPLMWRFVGRPWPDRVYTLEEFEMVAQFEPERIIGGVAVAFGWTMWFLLGAYAITGIVSVVAVAARGDEDDPVVS